MDKGIIYLLRDDAIWKKGVYKVGKSSNWKSRKNSYGNVRVLAMFETDFISQSEKLVIESFRGKCFTAKGNEYFLWKDEEAVLKLFLSVKDEVERTKEEMCRIHHAKLLPFGVIDNSENVLCEPSEKIESDEKIEPEEDTRGISSAEQTTNEEFQHLCTLRERTKEQNFKIKKWLMAYRFEVEQGDVTYEFVDTYKGLEKQFFNQRLAFEGTKEQQDERLRTMADEKNIKKQNYSEIEKLHGDLTLEKVVYAKRLMKLLGFEDVCEGKRIKSSEMASRIGNAREVVLKSKNFQALFGKVSKEESLFVRWANDVSRKMFGCYVGRNGKSKRAKWHLLFSAPWNHNGKIPETKAKLSEETKIPTVWKM
ncbi:putative replication origin-binding protein [Tokyovirus A1]|uniref:putative replication origin-binding protein n=1 Tax=Tokyovirus A1 TaxID=1826170 RepID=UPI0007A98A59|nr:putative replication origin-binding protein [Tokyovirus A1]BAU80091.1 putative replication origin-binding protein [Tokyovirus A1]